MLQIALVRILISLGRAHGVGGLLFLQRANEDAYFSTYSRITAGTRRGVDSTGSASRTTKGVGSAGLAAADCTTFHTGGGSPPSGRRRAPPRASARRVWRQLTAPMSTPQARDKRPHRGCCHQSGGGRSRRVGAARRQGRRLGGTGGCRVRQRPHRKHMTSAHSLVFIKGAGGSPPSGRRHAPSRASARRV